MTRLRTDQACLDAQVRCQVEQKLNAELAGERRDTEPCPPPSEGAFKRDLHAMIEAGLEQELLTRAAAREFYESVSGAFQRNLRTEIDAAWVEPEQDRHPEPERPVCDCGQTIWKQNHKAMGALVCGDCFWDKLRPEAKPLDKRIAETKSDDAPECAWSTPTSEGEGWRRG